MTAIDGTSHLGAAPTDTRRIAVLFSEGSSLSARQTLSALGPLGYAIDICDPNPLCLSRFSRFLRHFYRSPPSGKDPTGYLQFILDRVAQTRYDVLLPVHEQAFLFARAQRRLARTIGLALTEFDAFALLQSKATFARLCTEIGLPQPPTRIVRSQAELEAPRAFPYYLKAPYSTAGLGVWHVTNAAERATAIAALSARGLLDGCTDLVVQDVAPGVLCQAQAVFEHGQLIAVHCTSQQAVGMGGSQSARLSVDHPIVQTHLTRLGHRLGWHGALALDYCFEPTIGAPSYIEANPRLVEPMNAVLSGVNLPDILVQLSLGESFVDGPVKRGRVGVRSHSLLATLLGLAARGGSRTALAREIAYAFSKRGAYAGSEEDLTPLRLDALSALPLAAVCLALLAYPTSADRLSGRTVADYALTPAAIERIRTLDERTDAEQ